VRIRWADTLVARVAIEDDPSSWQAATYWSARWKLYPDVREPTALTSDVVRKRLALEALETFARTQPGSYYALLAAQRLYELDRSACAPWPGRTRPRPTRSPGRCARASCSTSARGRASPSRGSGSRRRDHRARLVRRGDALGPPRPCSSHECADRSIDRSVTTRSGQYLLSHPPTTLGSDEGAVLRYAYPTLYWDLVQEAAAGYAYDPRVFHGLVREESSFNPEIVSWAGRRGLSQLMPATGPRGRPEDGDHGSRWISSSIRRRTSRSARATSTR
jgi:hypothetical protein